MVCYKKVICKKGSRPNVDNITPPIQFRSQVIINLENVMHQIANSIPKAIFIYRLIKQFNIKFMLSLMGVTNHWVIFAILLLI